MFGIAKSVKSRVCECTPALFNKAIDDPQTGRACAEIADALEMVKRGEMTRDEFETKKAELKKQLPVLTPHATYTDGKRSNKSAVPSGLSIYDIDHINDPRGYYQHMVADRLGELGIVLAHVTPSSEGLRLLFIVPAGMSLAEAQKWMSEQLNDDNYDGSVKDLARCSFLVPRDYILYLDEEELFRQREAKDEIKEKKIKDKSEVAEKSEAKDNDSILLASKEPLPTYHGVEYAKIIEAWVGNKKVEKGDRHRTSLILADHLRYITDNDAQLIERIMREVPFVKEIVQERNEPVAQTIKDAQGYKMYRSLPKRLYEALATLNIEGEEEVDLDSAPLLNREGKGESLPPEMPRRLPPLIRLLVSRTPDIYKPAVAHAVFPSLAAHLYQTRFRYIDNVEHEATLMNCLMAETGAGKDCISEPINHIMADIRRRDEENLAREKAWKDEVNSKSANKDKQKRPEGLVIQEIDADMTGPAFVLRMAEADGHFLYTKINEIEQFDALKGNGKGGQQFQIICLAFDPRNRYGQTRVGTQSVTEKVTVRFNWNVTTTILKGQRYFQNVLTDGPLSRINFCTIPQREIGAPIPIYGTYDAAFDEELRPYIENLTKARGLIDCPQAFRLAKRLQQECAEFSRLSQSRTYENFTFRALVIAYLKACMLYVAHGHKWDKSMEDFVRWSLNYDLWCKMQFFGEKIEKVNKEAHKVGRPGPRNLLELLPDEFTLEDAIHVRRDQGLTLEGTNDMIRMWRKRKYIELRDPKRTDEQMNSSFFVKLKFRKN